MGYIFSRDNIQPAESPIIFEQVEISERDPNGGEVGRTRIGILRNPRRYSDGQLRMMQPAPVVKQDEGAKTPIFLRPTSDAAKRRARRELTKQLRRAEAPR